MPAIFDFPNYREYLTEWIAAQPNAGRGLKSEFARVLGVSSTLISFLLQGRSALSLEQASDLADFIGLNEPETEFLFLLVEVERAGNQRLKQKLERKIKTTQVAARRVSKRVQKDAQISDELKAIYYSSWVFTGIRNLVALGTFKDAAGIAKHLNLPTATVTKALQFLLENGLCVQTPEGLSSGPTYVHVDHDSPFVNKHHQNWRIRAFTAMDQKSEADLFYTSPMSLSREDAEKVRAMLVKNIEDILAVMRPSPSETVCCLNIDWFKL